MSQKFNIQVIIQHALYKKSSFVLADLLKLCWPLASFADIKHMRAHIDDYCHQIQRAEPPKLLHEEELLGKIVDD